MNKVPVEVEIEDRSDGEIIPRAIIWNDGRRFPISRVLYRTASGNVLPYANVKNAGLFCVKDYCNHGHTGSYTLVTPQGKLYFAQLREMILLVS